MKCSGCMKIMVWVFLGGWLAPGCGDLIPERSGDFSRVQDLADSFRDYLRLEKTGVEVIRLKTGLKRRMITLAAYLFTLAQGFERAGRDSDAAKLYLRLLSRYPVLHEGSQLGIMAENRLRWLIGDQHWLVPSAQELTNRLGFALQHRDITLLGRLMSRDFGFGRDSSDRFAITPAEGFALFSQGLQTLKSPARLEISAAGETEWRLKSPGWEDGRRTWYFVLHKNPRRQRWEWDLAYWEPNQ